ERKHRPRSPWPRREKLEICPIFLRSRSSPRAPMTAFPSARLPPRAARSRPSAARTHDGAEPMPARRGRCRVKPMRALPYVLVDVFTDRPLTGNPLAVFTDARDLDADTMQ